MPRTADIKLADARQMVANGLQPSQILLVPHHGSGTGFRDELLDAVRLGIAIAPVGYRNRYCHLKPSVMAAYETRKITLYRTDSDGMVQVDLPSMNVSACRLIHQRYWMNRASTAEAQDNQ